MHILQKTHHTVSLTALRLRQRVAEHPVTRRLRALRRGQVRVALGREEGQGLLEYILPLIHI